MNTSRWSKLWKAIVRWWKNELEPVAPPEFLQDARKLLVEYDDLYGKRIQIADPWHRSQAAEIVAREGHKRAPTLESEVRVLALMLERVVGHLEWQAFSSQEKDGGGELERGV